MHGERHFRKIMRVALAIVLASLATACISQTATPAVQGRAYVTDGSIFGTSVYSCAVVAGEPHCWRVTEKERR